MRHNKSIRRGMQSLKYNKGPTNKKNQKEMSFITFSIRLDLILHCMIHGPIYDIRLAPRLLTLFPLLLKKTFPASLQMCCSFTMHKQILLALLL